ncbi:MAG TPA: GtrA family protein [Polyangia bacterium]
MRFALLLRHQLGAAIATAIDFGTMIVWVEAGVGSAVSGTAAGAASGALSNFVLGRKWIFNTQPGRIRRQLARYGLVSLGSLGLNTVGQRYLLGVTSLPYPLTRTIIAILVGVLWNYPMHRWFVFPSGERKHNERAAAV